MVVHGGFLLFVCSKREESKQINRTRTLCGITGLVVLCEPAQIQVLDPRHPLLVLLVVHSGAVLAPGLLLAVGRLLLLLVVCLCVGHGCFCWTFLSLLLGIEVDWTRNDGVLVCSSLISIMYRQPNTQELLQAIKKLT